MKINFLRVLPFVLAFAVSGPAYGQTQIRSPESIPLETEDRGEYLAKHVAMCVQCHTPRSASGELDKTRYFEGAPMPAGAPNFSKDWAFQAPNIRGFLGYTDEEAVTFLQNRALRPDGSRPRAPMPPFEMNKEDAEAVVKYLKSLS